jgi:hypothetical protein
VIGHTNASDAIESIHYEEATGKLLTLKQTWEGKGNNIIWIQRRWLVGGDTEVEIVARIGDGMDMYVLPFLRSMCGNAR